MEMILLIVSRSQRRLVSGLAVHEPDTLGGLLVQAVEASGQFMFDAVVERIGGEQCHIDVGTKFRHAGRQVDQGTSVSYQWMETSQ